VSGVLNPAATDRRAGHATSRSATPWSADQIRDNGLGLLFVATHRRIFFKRVSLMLPGCAAAGAGRGCGPLGLWAGSAFRLNLSSRDDRRSSWLIGLRQHAGWSSAIRTAWRRATAGGRRCVWPCSIVGTRPCWLAHGVALLSFLAPPLLVSNRGLIRTFCLAGRWACHLLVRRPVILCCRLARGLCPGAQGG